MTTKEVIQRAERVNEAHYYSDNTILYDILVDDKAYVIRVDRDEFNKIRNERLQK